MIDYNNKIFKLKSKTKNSEVSDQTIFRYFQNGNIVTAYYSGGNIISGHLIAMSDANGILNMRYHHVNTDYDIMTGRCISTPEILENGKIRLNEKWKWTSGDKSKGESIIEEE